MIVIHHLKEIGTSRGSYLGLAALVPRSMRRVRGVSRCDVEEVDLRVGRNFGVLLRWALAAIRAKT